MGRSGPGRTIAIVVSLLITAAVTAILWYWFRESAFLNPDHMSSMDPASDNAEAVQDIYVLIFWLAGGVFVGVLALTLIFSFMFREKEGAEALQMHGNSRLEVLWTFVPVVIVVVMAVPTFNTIVDLEGDAPDDALEVIARGHQWWFEFEIPELGVVTANELHLPVDRPVNFTLESEDVIHSFWVPRLMGKKDMVPGHANQMWFTPNEIGEFRGQCAEYCGLSHANMRFRVFVVSPDDFDAWATAQAADAQASDDEAIAAGMQQFTQSGCIGCHTVRGNDLAQGTVGPDLTHLASRTTIASAIMDNTPENLAEWVHDAPGVKPGSIMPGFPSLSDEQIQNLVAYLTSLE